MSLKKNETKILIKIGAREINVNFHFQFKIHCKCENNLQLNTFRGETDTVCIKNNGLQSKKFAKVSLIKNKFI